MGLAPGQYGKHGVSGLTKERVIVVGAGMAGLRFVEELVAQAPGRFEIMLIGAEPEPPYNRVLLPAAVAGEARPEDLTLKPRSWGASHGVTLLTGVRVIRIAPRERRVFLSGGGAFAYDRLVLATGARPARLTAPGAGLARVMTFRDLADARTLAALRPGARVVIVGGGVLGLETACALARRGVAATVAHRGVRIMDRQFDAEAAGLVKRRIEALGVRILTGASVAAFEGVEAVDAVRLADGRLLSCDAAVMAIGAHPDTTLAAAAGIACREGVLVDDGLAASAPRLFALGECAEHRGVCCGLVAPAYEQARVLALRFAGAGDEARYEGSRPGVRLKVPGVEAFAVGEPDSAPGCEPLVFRDPAHGVYKKLQIQRDAAGMQRLSGATLIGDLEDAAWYAELIASSTPVDAIRPLLMFGRAAARLAA